MFGNHVRIDAQLLELVVVVAVGRRVDDLDTCQRVGAFGCHVLEGEGSGSVAEHVDDGPLRRSNDHIVNPLLALVASAVASHEFHLHTRKRHLEDAGVGRVREIEAHNLTTPDRQLLFGLASDQQDVSEPAHSREVRFVRIEGGDLPVFDQDVVKGEHDVSIRCGPVRGIRRLDDYVPVEAHLLSVVLAHVRVVPEQSGVGKAEPVRVAAPRRYRSLRLVRDTVVPVLEAQPVPVNGRLHVGFVGDDHLDLRALPDAQCGSGDRSVVGEHLCLDLAQALAHGCDDKIEPVTVVELYGAGVGRGAKRISVAGKGVLRIHIFSFPIRLVTSGYISALYPASSTAARMASVSIRSATTTTHPAWRSTSTAVTPLSRRIVLVMAFAPFPAVIPGTLKVSSAIASPSG